MALLEVEDLHVSFNTADGVVKAVRGLTFSVDKGQTVGIVGESGSGKSVSTQTIMGLTAGARVSGQARFEGRDLLTMNDRDLRAVRGAKVGMIFQDPLSSLHPYYKVGWQIVEMVQAHTTCRRPRPRTAPSTSSGWWASPSPRPASTSTRTSSPGACASAP